MTEKKILEFENKALVPLLFGEHNNNLSYLEEILGISIQDRGNCLTLSGAHDRILTAEQILNDLLKALENKKSVGKADIDAALKFMTDKTSGKSSKKPNKNLIIKTKKKSISPRSPNQARYLQTILDHDMTFGLGPAGTGKTYLAVAVGVSMFLEGTVERLIFTRPALEAGENLGFLPGDMNEKVAPYLRPIYDAMNDMLPWDFISKRIEDGEIEIAPLAFMRGRTLSNAFVILDEAQNTTCTQMKMFLTRMGESSRMVITGDITQTDLPRSIKSGLRDAKETLENIDDIKFIHFAKEDVTRNPLVSKIIHAYDEKS